MSVAAILAFIFLFLLTAFLIPSFQSYGNNSTITGNFTGPGASGVAAVMPFVPYLLMLIEAAIFVAFAARGRN